MKIVYVVGGLLAPSGMGAVLSAKINYLAEHTDYELYMILTEKAGQKWYYTINPKVHWINFDINFDELDTMPFLKKLFFYQQKQRRYKKMFTDYLMEVRPDITVSTVRREINFINDIPDGSKKVGEIHFNKSNYRNINFPFFPDSFNKYFSCKWMKSLEKQITRLDCFVVLTHKDAPYWSGISSVQVIPNFVTHFPKHYSSCVNKQVIAVGRYDQVKGFDLLIQAWKIIMKSHPQWKLDIYGPGNREVYQKMADDMGLGKVVHCNGSISDLDCKYTESSLFVLSSRNEGFGLVLVEAMAAGLPVVSFDCPCGPSDIIKDGEDGLLVENGNVEKLADAICWMISHPEERKLYGLQARRNAMRFSQDKVMAKWLNLFQSLVTS
jgi:glycosyltransferase involved in cell wall biosynthesis